MEKKFFGFTHCNILSNREEISLYIKFIHRKLIYVASTDHIHIFTTHNHFILFTISK